MNTVSIIGYGYVGGSIGHLCKQNDIRFNICDVTDKEEPFAEKIFSNISELVKYSESNNDINVYFVCVPTPSKENGQCDTSIVEFVTEELNNYSTKKTLVYIKSTVEIGTVRKLHEKLNFTVLFWPEFLRELTYLDDIYSAKFVLLGTCDGTVSDDITNVFKLLYKHNDSIQIIIKQFEECEIFKYTINTFLSVKVWFFNEVYQICEKFNVSYNEIQNMLKLDSRIGMSHTTVPGNDGTFGFSGSCFPKDTKAFRYLQSTLGINDSVLSELLKRNEEIRK
jgi:UDPglucose 6-dehydrogenase